MVNVEVTKIDKAGYFRNVMFYIYKVVFTEVFKKTIKAEYENENVPVHENTVPSVSHLESFQLCQRHIFTSV